MGGGEPSLYTIYHQDSQGLSCLLSTKCGGKNLYISHVFYVFYSGCCKVAVVKLSNLFDPFAPDKHQFLHTCLLG